MNKFVCLVLCSMAALGVANAQERTFADIYTDCGLGAMIAPNSDAVAAVTNVTWDLGTTAISSNSSSPDTCSGGKESSAKLIHDAYPLLEEELAHGSGEYVSALMTMAGCEAQAHDDITPALRRDLQELVSADDYAEQSRYTKSQNLFNSFVNRIHADYAAVCAIG